MLPLPLTSQVERVQGELFELRTKMSQLSTESQAQLAVELERFSASLSHLVAMNGQAADAHTASTSSQGVDTRLAESAEEGRRIARVMRGARAGIWHTDRIHGTVTWSPEARELFGVGPETPASVESFAAMIHPLDRANAVAYIQSSAQRGGSSYQEFRIVRPDGKVLWISSVGYAEHDADGRPISVTGINQDISDRKWPELFNQALDKINEIIHSTLDFDTILRQTVTLAAQAAGCDSAALSLKKGGRWVISAVHGLSEDVLGTEMDDDQERHAVLAIQTRQPVAVSDALTDERVNHEHMRRWGVRAVLAIPVIMHDESVGVIILNYHESPVAFHPAFLDFGARLAASLSLALENARLVTHLREEIAQRGRIEADLRESETRLSDLMEASPDLLWSTLADVRYAEYVNQAWLDYTGLSAASLLDQGWDITNHPDDIPRLHTLWAEAVQKSVGFEAEFRLRKWDGSFGWFWCRAVPLKSAEGQVTRWMGVLRNIDERRQAEQQLQQALAERIIEKNRLQAVMDALPVGVCILDMQGGVVQANAAFHDLWGGLPPTHRVEDYDAFDAWWAEDSPGSSEPVRLRAEDWAAARAVQNGETVLGQFLRIRRFDGSEAYVLNSGAPVRDANGQIVASVVAIMDISEGIETKRALRASESARKLGEERLHVALSSVPMMVYTCDREQRYTWVNQPLRGHTPQEMLGLRTDEVFPPGAAVELVAAKQWALDTGQSGVREIKISVDGHDSYYLLTMEPVFADSGEVAGLTCSSIDISSLRRMELAQREQRYQVEIQRRLLENREKERQSIALELHDGPIQTLVSTIFHVQFTKETLQDLQAQVELDQINLSLKGAVRELREMVNELRPPSLIRFGLAKAIRAHAEDFRDRHPRIVLDLVLDDDGDLLPEQTALALFRISQEALINVYRHANARHVTVRLKMEAREAILEIEDDGQGLDPLPDLALQTRAGHYGLAGMKERAEAAGGSLHISSTPSQGTLIQARVPIRRG